MGREDVVKSKESQKSSEKEKSGLDKKLDSLQGIGFSESKKLQDMADTGKLSSEQVVTFKEQKENQFLKDHLGPSLDNATLGVLPDKIMRVKESRDDIYRSGDFLKPETVKLLGSVVDHAAYMDKYYRDIADNGIAAAPNPDYIAKAVEFKKMMEESRTLSDIIKKRMK